MTTGERILRAALGPALPPADLAVAARAVACVGVRRPWSIEAAASIASP
jgi:hypothetical protein